MASQNILIITLPITILFGIAFWLMIFLNVYSHFPKLNSKEKFWRSIIDATVLTFLLLGIVYLFLWFILNRFFK